MIKKHKQQTNHKECLSRHLNNNAIFYSTEDWERLFDSLKSKKLEEHKRKAEILKDQSAPTNIKKGIQFIGAGLGKLGGFFKTADKLTKPLSEEEREVESEVSYSVLEELNKHLLNLELAAQFASDLIIDFAHRKKAKMELIPRLLEKQENKKNSEMRRNLHIRRSAKKRQLIVNMDYPQQRI